MQLANVRRTTLLVASDLQRLEQRYDVLRGYHKRDVRLLETRALRIVDSVSFDVVSLVIVKVDLDQLYRLADSENALVGDAITRATAVARVHVDVDQITVQLRVGHESLLQVFEHLINALVAPRARDDAGTVQEIAIAKRETRDQHGLPVFRTLRFEFGHRRAIHAPGPESDAVRERSSGFHLEQREIVSFVGRNHPRAEHRHVATNLFARWGRKADLQVLPSDVTHDVQRGRDDPVIYVPATDDDTRTDWLLGITVVDRDDAGPHARDRLLRTHDAILPAAFGTNCPTVLVRGFDEEQAPH